VQTTGQCPEGGIGVRFRNVNFELKLDFFGVPTTQRVIDVRLQDVENNVIEITPRILFSRVVSAGEEDGELFDPSDRRDSQGAVARTFEWAGSVKLTAEEFYGNELIQMSTNRSGYEFRNWKSAATGAVIPSVAGDPLSIIIPNNGQQRVIAVYEQVGDRTPPEVESIELLAAEKSGETATYQVIFSERVVGVDAKDFAFEGGAPGSAVTSVEGSGATRIVRVNLDQVPTNASTFGLADNDSILDFTGNSLAGDGTGNGNANVTIVGTGSLPLVISNPVRSNEGFSFQLIGETNTRYRIETSGNLAGPWSPGVVITTNASGEVVTPKLTAEANRFFYRVRKIQD